MTNAKKLYLAVSGGIVALGLVLVAIGFIVSSFDQNVFGARIDADNDSVVLGGTVVEDPTELPLID